MKKIILFNSDLCGGAGKFIETLSSALHQKGAEVHVILCNDNMDYILKDGVSLHILSERQVSLSKKTYFVDRLRNTLKKIGNYNLIVSNSTPSNQILMKLKAPNSFHCIHSSEVKEYRGISAPFRTLLRNIKYKNLYKGKHLITVSKDLEKYISNKFHSPYETIRTIYNPFDFEEIHSLSRKKVRNIPDIPYLIHVGRMDLKSKRHDILLRAYSLANPPYPLVLLGDGPDRKEIEKIIQDLDLKKKVFLPGYSSNPYAWIKHAKLLLLSSDFEGFPRVLIESFALSTPVISTDCPTGPKEILHRYNLKEYLVTVGDIEGLAAKIIQALSSYPDLSQIDLSYLDKTKIAEQYLLLCEPKQGISHV